MDNGITWVQLRIKDESKEVITEAAGQFLELCHSFRATACLNDYAEVAAAMNFPALHLGKEDESPDMARKMFTGDVIIGGTANNWEDIERINADVDYVGLGPMRFTQTKKKLSPVLGLEGYRELLNMTRTPRTPAIAIGGIQANDALPLADTGVQGIAISGYLIDIDFNEKIIQQMQRAFNGTQLLNTWID
jgi:thiamine-phosphate pyrophosphorylase